jgi:hypothetical protein
MFWLALHPSFLSGQPVPLTSKNLSMAYDFAFRNHETQPYPGRGVLFRAREAKAGFYDAADRGWSGMFAGGLEIQHVPGDHLTMLDEPHARAVSERLTECLHKAQLEAALPNEFGCQAHESYARAELAEIKKDTSA